MVQNQIPAIFNSPTFGQLNWQEAIGRMFKFISADTKASYEVIIGTDSEAKNGVSDFVSAIIVHKKGRGGIYFWGRQKIDNLYSMRQRIWQEAVISLALAQNLVADFAPMGMFDPSTHSTSSGRASSGQVSSSEFGTGLDLEIHVDIGPNGETRAMINEIVGMIRANGFKVATKPSSWGASHVADRHV